MTLRIFLFSTFIVLITNSCSRTNIEKFDNQVIKENKFSVNENREIYQLMVGKKSKELINFLENSNPALRETAAMSFASLQDTLAVKSLLKILADDKSVRVKASAAFALGQMRDSIAEEQLMRLADNEKSEKVRNNIYEAIGKCGTKKGHDFLIEQLENSTGNNDFSGILSGLARFSIRGIASENAINLIIRILKDDTRNEDEVYNASIYLIRLKGWDLSKYTVDLKTAFEGTKNIYTKLNLITAMSLAINKESFDFLTSRISPYHDYRLRVNAIKSLYVFQYGEIGQMMMNLLNDSNYHVGVQASEYFLAKGISQDAYYYFTQSKKINDWRVRANMFTAALRLSPQKDELSKYIIGEYQKAKNIYEKANLLRALGGDFNNFSFIRDEINKSNFIQVKTAGTEALSDMRRSDSFDKYRNKMLLMGKPDFEIDFANIFKEAINSGDMARVGIAAEIIRDPKFNFRKLYENSFFLTQALNNCKLPSGIETYRELQKTIAFINGTEYKEDTIKPTFKPDWDYISKIPFQQNVIIYTSKGKIGVELFVNEAPVSVSNFLKLIAEGYYNNRIVHRVVPNFVIQDGCPRGDGWGGPDYTICSEFPMNYYTEGSLGMASAGKDTEGSQWFITHSPTPHLDGRYTNFGKVVNGIEVVHQIQVGDTIYSMEIVQKK